MTSALKAKVAKSLFAGDYVRLQKLVDFNPTSSCRREYLRAATIGSGLVFGKTPAGYCIDKERSNFAQFAEWCRLRNNFQVFCMVVQAREEQPRD